MNLMTGDSERQLENLIHEIMEDSCARGIAAGVVDAEGNILYEKYFGWRDEEKKLPINRDTIFGMASVTKSFTALSIMQMQMDGILHIEDMVKTYIPEFTNKNQKDPVRLWHLLCHSGGYFPLPRIVVDKTASAMGLTDTMEDQLIYHKGFADEGVKLVAQRLDSQTRFTGRPGERMSYCNDGFGLLSDIVRRHSDCDSFADYLDKHILKPLDMNRSNISFIKNTLDENAAILYSREEDGRWRCDRDYQNDAFVLHGGGAMKSTLGDMLKYAVMYLNEGTGMNGNRIIDRYSIHEMCKPRQFMKPGVYYGYGLETKQMNDMTVIEHGGSLPGVSSNFAFCPQAGIGVVVLCNTMDVPVYAISDGILRSCCGLPIFEERISHTPYRWTEEEKRELCGEYISGEGDRFVLKKNASGSLDMVVNGSPVELTPVYPWQGMVRKKYTDVYLTAVRDEEGKVFAARYGSRIFPKTYETD
ncbi:MAG TPA: beta-lactamase family protein [Candidatus Blautia stercorigallinarum]|uniref:Beta-lactamase family protein n=1 Tax=Candidatus Blautia stercorigallinarum TaxID=2838501 RepID=A0A9D1PFG5_9FIRM|nr:beta-lactamase family protein [Candidatus Blautia stercorigallinarum]